MYSNSTYKDFNIDTSKTFQDIGNNEDLANVSIALADEELVKCLICMKVITNSSPGHRQGTKPRLDCHGEADTTY